MPTCCSLLALRFRIQLPKDRDIVHDLSQPLLYPEIFFWVQFQPAAGPNVTWRNLSQARCGVLTRTIRPQSMPKYRQIALQFGLRWFMCMLHVYLCVCAVYCILMFIQRIPYVYAHIWTFIFDHIWSYLIILVRADMWPLANILAAGNRWELAIAANCRFPFVAFCVIGSDSLSETALQTAWKYVCNRSQL